MFSKDLKKSFTSGSQFLAIFWISDFILFVIVMPLTFPSSVTPINTLPPEEFANATKSLSTPERSILHLLVILKLVLFYPFFFYVGLQ